VIGATEIESEDDSPMSVRSSLELLSAAYTLHSGFAEARILEMSTQCRPSFKNNLPKIIQSNSKIIHVNGLYRHGFLIAPAIVDSVMKLIEQKDDSLIKHFEIDYQEAKYEHIC
jgi:glycine oxidase